MTIPEANATPRLVRDEPVRTEPLRQPARMFLPTTPTTVHRGVENAYRVIDEYLAQGRACARERPSRFSTITAPPDLSQAWATIVQSAALPAAVLRAWAEIAAGVGDFAKLQQAAQGLLQAGKGLEHVFPSLLSYAEGFANRTHSPAAASAPGMSTSAKAQAPAPRRTVVQSRSRKPITVDVQLSEAVGQAAIRMSPLFAARGDAAPIRGANLSISSESDVVKLEISVLDDQADGEYSAMIFRDIDDKPCGTVSVVVGG